MAGGRGERAKSSRSNGVPAGAGEGGEEWRCDLSGEFADDWEAVGRRQAVPQATIRLLRERTADWIALGMGLSRTHPSGRKRTSEENHQPSAAGISGGSAEERDYRYGAFTRDSGKGRHDEGARTRVWASVAGAGRTRCGAAVEISADAVERLARGSGYDDRCHFFAEFLPVTNL